MSKAKTSRSCARAIGSTAAMFVGGTLYLLWRDSSLLMFEWFDALGASPLIAAVRSLAAPYRQSLPPWVCYSLPEALWLYSGLLGFGCIWGRNRGRGYWFWVVVLASSALGSEVGQYVGLVPGRFDAVDLSLMSLACAVAVLPAIVLARWKKGVGDVEALSVGSTYGSLGGTRLWER